MSGIVYSGMIRSGQIGFYQIASGSISSGSIGTASYPSRHALSLAFSGGRKGEIYQYNTSDFWQQKIAWMMASETEKGFWNSIADNPHDPELRLVYSDWLEEQGRLQEAKQERQAAEILEKAK